MSTDFKKLGLDRMATNIAKSVSSGLGSGGLITGDITRNDIVTVTVGAAGAGATSGTAQVKARRTAAIPISVVFPGDDPTAYLWSIDGTTLTVGFGAVSRHAILTFLVY